MMKWLLYILLVVMGACIGYICPKKPQFIKYETLRIDTVRDTIPDNAPYPIASIPLPIRAYFIDRAIKGDTIHDTIYLPAKQVEYKTNLYHAWLSGLDPKLDSIYIYQPTIVKTQVERQRKWNIGIQAGYGITSRGLSPYIGFGIALKIY